MTSNKPNRRDIITQSIKVLFFILALVIAYLFALNGRYIKQDTDEYFDKWTKSIIVTNKYTEID